jgi:hypothetical protein
MDPTYGGNFDILKGFCMRTRIGYPNARTLNIVTYTPVAKSEQSTTHFHGYL